MSSGVPTRLTGMPSMIALVRGDSGGFAELNSGVAIGPGPTALTVMPCGASSSAQVRVMPMSPAFAAA
jgi:hypothetical protein